MRRNSETVVNFELKYNCPCHFVSENGGKTLNIVVPLYILFAVHNNLLPMSHAYRHSLDTHLVVL